MFNNTFVVYDKLFEIRKDNQDYIYYENNVTYIPENQTITLTAKIDDNNDSRAGIRTFSNLYTTTQVVADVNLSATSTNYNKGVMWAVFEDVIINSGNDINITNNKANIYAGIQVKDKGLFTWISVYDENWNQTWSFDDIDYNTTIIYDNTTLTTLNQRIKLDIKLVENKLIFSAYDENNNTIGNILEYENSYINFDSIDRTELRARVDDAKALTYGEEAGSITTMQVYGLQSSEISSQYMNLNISDYNSSEHTITAIRYIGQGDNNEIFIIAGSENLTNGDNNISVPIVNFDQNFSLEVTLDDSSIWWYNFSDGKLYSTKGSDVDFVTIISSANRNFTFDDISANFIPKTTISNISDLNLAEDFNSTILSININNINGDDLIMIAEYNSSIIDINSSSFDTLLNQATYTQPIDLNITSFNNVYGYTDVVIYVENTYKDSNATQTFRINISSINDIPILDAINDINITTLDDYNITLTSNDEDGDNLIYSYTLNTTIATAFVTNDILTISPVSSGETTCIIAVSDGNGGTTSQSFNIAVDEDFDVPANMDRIKLQNGWNFVSFPSSNIICDSSIYQDSALLISLCDQNNTLNSILNDSNIQRVFKFIGGNWAYWDKESTLNTGYLMDKFTSLTSKEGFAIQTTASVNILIPKAQSNELDDFITLDNTNHWYLVGVNEDKTVEEINTIVTNQGKTLEYMWLFRNNIWYAYEDVAGSIDVTIPKFTEVKKHESFWIYIQ